MNHAPHSSHTPSRRWQARSIDLAMLALLAVNVLGALLIGQMRGQLLLAVQAGAAIGLAAALGVMLTRGSAASRLVVALGLAALVSLQIHLSGGALQYHFNVFISLGMLLVYRDWRPIAFMAALVAAQHIVFDRLLQAGWGTYCLSAPDPQQIMLHVGFVVVQAAVLCRVAVEQRREANESIELENMSTPWKAMVWCSCSRRRLRPGLSWGGACSTCKAPW